MLINQITKHEGIRDPRTPFTRGVTFDRSRTRRISCSSILLNPYDQNDHRQEASISCEYTLISVLINDVTRNAIAASVSITLPTSIPKGSRRDSLRILHRMEPRDYPTVEGSAATLSDPLSARSRERIINGRAYTGPAIGRAIGP